MVYDKDAGEEIRVTVVATGLSGEAPAMRIAASGDSETQEFKMPRIPSRSLGAIVSANQPQGRPGTPAQQAQPQLFGQREFNEDEFSVPTFLRRQAD